MSTQAATVEKLTAGGGGDGFWAWRDAVSPLFEISGNGRGSDPVRQGALSLWSMGQTVLGLCESSGHRFHRGGATIATSGLDQILVQLLLDGEDAVLSGAGDSLCRPGDIRIADLTRPLETATGPYRNLTLIMPRALIGASVDAQDRLHGLVLRREAAATRLLAGHMTDVLEAADDLQPDTAAALAPASAGLVSACLAASGLPLETPDRDGSGRLAAIRGYIDRNLGSPGLSLESLCGRLGLSRSTVYRLFEPHGGVAGYIRRQRLQRAYRRLAGTSGRVRIGEVAVECGFASPGAFSRAFRDAYGMSPREAGRDLPRRRGPGGKTLQSWLSRA